MKKNWLLSVFLFFLRHYQNEEIFFTKSVVILLKDRQNMLKLFLFSRHEPASKFFFISSNIEYSEHALIPYITYKCTDRILAPCNYCHHPWCGSHKSYHKALLTMFGCDGISDHASWNEAFHYWDTKLSWTHITIHSIFTPMQDIKT